MNAIEVKDLCVTYRIKKSSIKRGISQKEQIIEAVKNVSFSVPKGEIWGIIGKNGSGKSTLLKTIGGVFSPDSGTITLDGRVSLQAIGIGFNSELTGRENIFLSGLLMGLEKREILEKIDEIIDFSELGEFIDRPVKTYSSGMRSKLAFSVTAVLETEIMLIDEVLSVGDEHFKNKSLKKMKSLMKDENRTVLIVSHSISTLRSLCTQVIWFNEGQIKKIGTPEEVLNEYVK